MKDLREKHRFKENETYLHKYSKDILAKWLKEYYLRVDIEDKFCMMGEIMFIPDLACYDENGISTLFEVVYKSDLTNEKLFKINWYCRLHDIGLSVYTIHVNYVMKQVCEPSYEQIIKATMKNYQFPKPEF